MSQDYCRVCQVQIDSLWLRCPVCGALTMNGVSASKEKVRESRARLGHCALWLALIGVACIAIYVLMGVITGGSDIGGAAPRPRALEQVEP